MAGLTKEQRAAKQSAMDKVQAEHSKSGESLIGGGGTADLTQVGVKPVGSNQITTTERLASNLQLHAGLDALGASLTVSLKKNASKIVMESNGAYVYGKKSDGKIFIPYANIRGAVLI